MIILARAALARTWLVVSVAAIGGCATAHRPFRTSTVPVVVQEGSLGDRARREANAKP